MCDFCKEGYTREDLAGSEGIIYKDGKAYIYAEHFRNEYAEFEATYCPECGKKLIES